MGRRARQESMTGIYHVTIRGINKQEVFESEKDFSKFLEIILCCQIKDHFEVYAFCLMSNHIHLLIKTEELPIGTVIGRILTTFAVWYNRKYRRVGHLFQNRFYSDPIEDKVYFLSALRYILQNPLKAGLEKYPGESYLWSSLHAYYGIDDGITNIEYVKQFFLMKKIFFIF